MRRITRTQEQMAALLRNDNVVTCSERYILYSKKFKMDALALHAQGMTSTDIFKQAGFDPLVIDAEQRHDCLKRWRKIFKKKGVEGLTETRGRPRMQEKSKHLTPTDKIKRLEAEVAYLKAENDFLAKLRANKRAG